VIELGHDDTYAQLGNVLMERGATEPVEDFRERARDLARDLDAAVLIWGRMEPIVWVDDVQTINIAGGLKDDATGDFATIGDELIERGEGELIEAFRARERARAFGLGSSHVVFGGLPPMRFED
jgi:hypothetical protein